MESRLLHVLTACCLLALSARAGAADETPSAAAPRQSLDDAWWTGPILAASASTLPRGRALIEPYIFDVISYGRYDASGSRDNVADTHSFGSLTYMLYGLTDQVTVGLIPTFAFNDVNDGADSSGVRVGDLTLQAQYRLTQFREGRPLPTISVVLQETLPTGRHDRLGSRPSDGVGGGAYATTLAVYSQHYFWLPNGRILRTRLNVSHTFADDTSVEGVSVYGSGAGFRGRAEPGDFYAVNLAGEYSVTRNWVLALDVLYQRNAGTRLAGHTTQLVNGEVQSVAVDQRTRSSRLWGVAPAIEYNFTSRVGVIVGARWFPSGRNTAASITPVAAVNMVF